MRVTYIVYWGLIEPLGRSLVLPAIRKMAQAGLAIDLITFEKGSDFEDRETVARIATELRAGKVNWRPLRYHKRPTVPATLFDTAAGIVSALRLARPDVIHGRTFIGGLIAMIAAALRRVPFVYHNEGFWPDQQVEGGFWKPGSVVYRMTKAIEMALYGRARGIVLLARRSQPIVEALPTVRLRQRPIAIVTSCVDAARFRCTSPRRAELDAGVRLIYVGSLGGRYGIEPLGEFLRILRSRVAGSTLEILSHSEHEEVRRVLAPIVAEDASWTLRRIAHEDVPARLCGAHAGLFFLKGGIGAESCSPTKVGEYWACGLPVVMSSGVGDIDDVVRDRRVGVLVADQSGAGLERAAQDLLDLLREPGLPERCRAAALDHYDLERGVTAQISLFERVIRDGTRSR